MSDTDKIPHHVAIIMDGNGRWAQERGEKRAFGHAQGAENVRRVIRAAAARGVAYLTLYAFSTENWGRPQDEVDALMELLCTSVINEKDELRAEGARVRVIGDRSRMSAKVKRHLDIIENETDDGNVITVLIALNYSSRSEIAHAAQIIAREAAGGKLSPDDIDEQTIAKFLYTAPYPDPDLLIRTGGEYRLSNFLLWQGAYSELYFTDVYWPDFDKKELDAAISAYTARERRFGLVHDTAN